MILKFKCDGCEKEFAGSSFGMECDGNLCERCYVEEQLYSARLKRDDRKNSLEAAQKRLNEASRRVVELEASLAAIEQAEK